MHSIVFRAGFYTPLPLTRGVLGLRPQIGQITSAFGLGFTIIVLDFGGFNRIIDVNLGLVRPLLLLTSNRT